MALNYFIGRVSYFHRSVSVLPNSVGFSTVANINLGSLIETEPPPDLEAITNNGEFSPFVLIEDDDDDDIWLRSVNRNEDLRVKVFRDPIVSEHEPLIIPMEVRIARGNNDMIFDICATRNQIKIESFHMRDPSLNKFEGFLRSKGINSDLVNMFCDHFGIKRKNCTKLNH